MNEITINELKDYIKDIKENLNNFDFYLMHGATTQDYCNEKQDLINNFNAFIKLLDAYANQESIKELERIESEM